MFDIIKSSPLSPEDLNKINTWRQEIKNGGVENIDNPTKEVVEEHSQIYNSLTEDEKQTLLLLPYSRSIIPTALDCLYFNLLPMK